MEFTKERIEELKAQYGEVHLLRVEDKSALLKSPTRKTLSYASTVGKNNPMKYNEMVLNDCWIDGDQEIKTNTAYFLGAIGQLEQLIEVKESSLEKL